MFNVFIMLNVEQSAATSVVQILSLLLVSLTVDDAAVHERTVCHTEFLRWPRL